MYIYIADRDGDRSPYQFQFQFSAGFSSKHFVNESSTMAPTPSFTSGQMSRRATRSVRALAGSPSSSSSSLLLLLLLS